MSHFRIHQGISDKGIKHSEVRLHVPKEGGYNAYGAVHSYKAKLRQGIGKGMIHAPYIKPGVEEMYVFLSFKEM